MKKLLIITILFFSLPFLIQGQKKISIANTGVNYSAPCLPQTDRSQSKDSSTVYNGECQSGNTTYGFILVKLLHRKDNLQEAEKITADYLQYLNQSFNITHAENYKAGLLLNNNQKTRGIHDEWADANQNKWLVNAWTNGSFIAVLYTYGKNLQESTAAIFLNSLRFPQ